MNTKYTQIFLFLSRLSQKNNKGFAMAFCLTIGVVLAATGTAMLMRSSNENKNVAAQQNTARGLAKADVAVTRLVYFLNQPQHRELITTPLNDWEDFASANNQSNNNNNNNDNAGDGENGIEGVSCDGNSNTEDENAGNENAEDENADEVEEVNIAMLQKLLAQEWIPIDSNDPSAGDYRLRDYCLVEPETIGDERKCPTNPEIPDDIDRVWLQVEARAVHYDSNDLKTNNSLRAIEAMVPINRIPSEEEEEEEGEAPDIPGLWVSDTNDGSGGRIDNAKLSSNDYKAVNAVSWVDCTHSKNDSSLVQKNKIDTSSITIRGQQVTPEFNKVRDDLPGAPSIPNSYFSGVFNSIEISDCYSTLPRNGLGKNKEWGGKSECKQINDGTVDSPVGKIYYYKFTGDDSLKVNNGQLRIDPPEGRKVVIVIEGGFQVDGTGDKGFNPKQTPKCISHTENHNTKMNVDSYIGDPDDPSKLEIYSKSTSKEFKLSGQNLVSGFVHVPKTKILISQSEIRGAAWAKEFDASNSGGGSSGCAYAVRQMDVGTPLVLSGGDESEVEETEPSEVPPTLGTIGTYRTLEAN
ncbi:MAG: hypothetical protein AB4062_00795 [Crocosphaera sp.]